MRFIVHLLLASMVLLITSGTTVLDRYKGFIVGPDERVIIDHPDFPWTAIGRIDVYEGPNLRQFSHYCTGTLVGERLVLTSANCLYLRNSGELAGSFVFNSYFRNCEPVFVSEIVHVYIPECYRYSAYPRKLIGGKYDWAVGVLADPIGRNAGFFEVIDVSHINLKWPRADFNTGGFEQKDQPRLQAHLDCVIQETDADQTLLYHACNTVPGFSGAPLWFMWNCRPTVVGVNNMSAFKEIPCNNETVPAYGVAASRDFVYKVLEYRCLYYDLECPALELREQMEKEKEKARGHPLHQIHQQLHQHLQQLLQ